MSDTTSETPAQARLRQAREALAAQQAEQQAEQAGVERPTEDDALAVGALFHAIHTGLTLPRSTSIWGGEPAIISERGRTYVLTQEMRQAAVNRHGAPGWPALVGDPAAQIRRWGRQYLGLGPAPEGLASWEHGSPEWAEARAAAHAAAVAEPDAEQRAAKLAEIQRVFGNPPGTGQSLRYNVDREDDVQREGRATPRMRVQL